METEPKPRRQRKRFRESEKRSVVTAWRESGLPAKAFAKQAGLNASNLFRWQSELERQTLPPVASQASASFVELQVARPEASPSVHGQATVSPHFEIEGPFGLRVRVFPGADAETLFRLLAMLPGGDRC